MDYTFEGKENKIAMDHLLNNKPAHNPLPQNCVSNLGRGKSVSFY